ncbi:MAG: peptidoglycan-binding domain-containing protein, partial [Pseudonocardiaceae bacterium]
INATQHPLGKRGTLTREQIARLSAKANQLGLRLGANYSGRVDEMHVEVIVTRERALQLVAALQSAPGAPAPDPSPATPGGRPTIRLGSRGDAVTEAQRLLTAQGDSVGPIDGIFGRRTEFATMAFQKRSGLTADGIIGAHTWIALLASATGDSGG